MLNNNELYKIKEKTNFDDVNNRWLVPLFFLRQGQVVFPKQKARETVKQELQGRELVIEETQPTQSSLGEFEGGNYSHVDRSEAVSHYSGRFLQQESAKQSRRNVNEQVINKSMSEAKFSRANFNVANLRGGHSALDVHAGEASPQRLLPLQSRPSLPPTDLSQGQKGDLGRNSKARLQPLLQPSTSM